ALGALLATGIALRADAPLSIPEIPAVRNVYEGIWRIGHVRKPELFRESYREGGLSGFLGLGYCWVEDLEEVAPCRKAGWTFWPGFWTPEAGAAADLPSPLGWPRSS
ncbi:hypothetical protein, partial [Thermoflexus hugenholtzii]